MAVIIRTYFIHNRLELNGINTKTIKDGGYTVQNQSIMQLQQKKQMVNVFQIKCMPLKIPIMKMFG